MEEYGERLINQIYNETRVELLSVLLAEKLEKKFNYTDVINIWEKSIPKILDLKYHENGEYYFTTSNLISKIILDILIYKLKITENAFKEFSILKKSNNPLLYRELKNQIIEFDEHSSDLSKIIKSIHQFNLSKEENLKLVKVNDLEIKLRLLNIKYKIKSIFR